MSSTTLEGETRKAPRGQAYNGDLETAGEDDNEHDGDDDDDEDDGDLDDGGNGDDRDLFLIDQSAGGVLGGVGGVGGNERERGGRERVVVGEA